MHQPVHQYGGPFYLDSGTGSSALTCQAMLGLSYALDWDGWLQMYRHLEYDQDSDRPLQNFSFNGLVIGVRFSF
ncbi:MAG: hypothetical protein O6931_03480 [Gammaproteobacteria bacterium]|nr:hypothetical protein [Gammaproteobacteria bacterium]